MRICFSFSYRTAYTLRDAKSKERKDRHAHLHYGAMEARLATFASCTFNFTRVAFSLAGGLKKEKTLRATAFFFLSKPFLMASKAALATKLFA